MATLCVLTVVCGGGAAAATLDELERGVLAAPADVQATGRLAGAYREQGETRRAVEFFTRFHQTNQPNAQSLVWQGSFKAMCASTENDIETRMNLLQSGIADMDRAVRLFRDDSRARAVRGISYSRFPPFMQMHVKAIQDLEAALRAPDNLSPGLRTAARQGLERAYRQAGRTADADALARP
jgi:tetratricopeptide (TPR) repeat protein